MLRFSAFDPASITAEIDALSRCHDFGRSVPFGLLQSNNVTPFAAQGLTRVSMWPIPLTPLTAAVRTLNVPNASSSSRDLALAALCFMQAFVSASPVAFSKQMPSAFRSVPRIFYPGSCLHSSDVMGVALPIHLDFSIVDTFSYLRVPSEHPYSPRFESHVFRGGGVPTCGLLPRENISLCWEPH